MGLDTTHDCWHGAYSAFMRWRQALAEAAGLPPLELMEGFYSPINGDGLPTLYHGPNTSTPAYGADSKPYLGRIDERLPIRWSSLKRSPLHSLLYHSDCDGSIPWRCCGPIANELEKLLPVLDAMGDLGGHIGQCGDKTRQFIKGLRAASAAREKVEFQ